MRKQKSGANTKDLLICHSLHIGYKQSNSDQNKRNSFFQEYSTFISCRIHSQHSKCIKSECLSKTETEPLECPVVSSHAAHVRHAVCPASLFLYTRLHAQFDFVAWASLHRRSQNDLSLQPWDITHIQRRRNSWVKSAVSSATWPKVCETYSPVKGCKRQSYFLLKRGLGCFLV